MMGKGTYIGPVPPDDPMFSEGWSIFSVRSPRLKKTSRKGTASQQTEDSTSESQNDSKTPPESED